MLALARALIEHPERTLNSAEIDQVIMQALAAESLALEGQRRGDWQRTTASAASFASLIPFLTPNRACPWGSHISLDKDSPSPVPSLPTR